MTEKMENGLFIFRRDLRIVDNNGLNLEYSFIATLLWMLECPCYSFPQSA